MRVALVGCGRIAAWHLSALQALDGLQIVATCDRDKYRAGQFAAMVQGATAYTDLGALLAEQKPDAVHILTPPDSHADLAVQAMEAGAHVLVEKPMTVSVEAAERMVAAARERGVRLCVNHNYLFKPSVSKARQLVASGEIGEVIYVNSYYGLSGEATAYSGQGGRFHWAWRLPGGVFTNFLPHLLYLQLAFLGTVEAVKGVTLTMPEEGDTLPTDLGVLLQGPRAFGTMTISMRTKPYAKYVDIYGTQGIVHADLVREVCTVHKPHRAPKMLSKALFNLEDSTQLATGTVVNMAQVALGRMKSMPELYTLIRLFYDSLRRGVEVPVPGEAGREVVALMQDIWAQAPALSAQPETPPVAVQVTGVQTTAERAVIERGGIAGRVLVTGATGFLGHHLVPALVRCGAQVTALVRDVGGVAPDLARQVTLACGDVRDRAALEAAMRGVDIVFHCAAVTTNKALWSEHQAVNVQGTENVLHAARQAGVRRVIYTSSVVVYGLDGSPTNAPLPESTPYAEHPDRWAYYLRSKLEADRLALEYGRAHGLEVTVLRLGILFGPGAGRAPGRGFVELGPLRLLIGRGGNALPYTYVGNAVDCLLLAAVTPEAAGQAYNVMDEPQISVRNMTALRRRIAQERARIVPLPPVALDGLARLLEWRSARHDSLTPPGLSRFVVRSACRDVRYDTSKARQQLGWQPEISLDEGLRRTLASSAE